MKLKQILSLLAICIFTTSIAYHSNTAYASSRSQRFTVAEFIDIYRNNPVNASKKYTGKSIRLTGYIVESVTAIQDGDKDSAYYIRISDTQDGGRRNSIKCVFPKSEKKELKKLSLGQQVIIKGKVTEPDQRSGLPGLRKASRKYN